MSTTASEAAHASRVGGLIKALRDDLSLKDLEDTYLENNELKEKIQRLEATCLVNANLLAKAQAELNAAKEDAQKKSSKLETEDKHKKSLTAQYNGTCQKLEETEKKLAELNSAIKRYQGFSVVLHPLSNNLELTARVKGSFQIMFEAARAFAEAYFRDNYSPENLEDGEAWVRFRTLKPESIPLIPTNKLPAIQMRVAAALAIISITLARHIFQPVYVSNYDAGLVNFLSFLSVDNHQQEAYLRSVLLKSLQIADDRHHKTTAQRVKIAVKELCECFVPVFELQGNDRRNIITAIDKLCRDACNHWQYIQQIQEHIELGFEFDKDYVKDWSPFIFSDPSTSLNGPAPKLQQNGASPSSNGGPGRPKIKQPSQAPDIPVGQDLSKVVLWPTFIIAHDMEPLVKGYVLRESHLVAAQEEVKKLEEEAKKLDEEEKTQGSSGTRRNQRAQRRKSTPGTDEYLGPPFLGAGGRARSGS